MNDIKKLYNSYIAFVVDWHFFSRLWWLFEHVLDPYTEKTNKMYSRETAPSLATS